MATSTIKNITPANIGAVNKTGDTMTGSLVINNAWLQVNNGDIVQISGYIRGETQTTENYVNHGIKLGHANNDQMQFLEYSGEFTFYQAQNGTYTPLFQIANGVSGAPLRLDNGGTGATNAPDARNNLDVYSKSEVDSAIQQTITLQNVSASSSSELANNIQSAAFNMRSYSTLPIFFWFGGSTDSTLTYSTTYAGILCKLDSEGYFFTGSFTNNIGQMIIISRSGSSGNVLIERVK